MSLAGRICPAASASSADLGDPPAVPQAWLAPKLTPEMILMLTVARAETLLTG
jgi:hypothetical protein